MSAHNPSSSLKLILLLLLASLFANTVYSQEIGFDLRDIYAKSISQALLSEAETLVDLNPGFPASFIKTEDYQAVEIKTTCGAVEKNESGSGHILTENQKEILSCADLGSTMTMVVNYNSKNVVTQKTELRTLTYALKVSPHRRASYAGGYDALRAYMRAQVLNNISTDLTEQVLGTGSVQFVVDEQGQIARPELTGSTGNMQLDLLIMQAIQAMPEWIPALDSEGQGVKQEFEMLVGNMLGC